MSALPEAPDLRTVLKTMFTVILFGAIVTYLTFQARFLIVGPMLTVDTDFHPVYNQRIVTITGNVQHSVDITLNGRTVYLDEQGNFAEPLVLENGYTIMSLRARDRYGRETIINKSLVYRPVSSFNL